MPLVVMGDNLIDPSAEEHMLEIAQVRTRVKGPVIAPGDVEYDAARTVFVGGIDRRPAVIVRAADATDVSAVVALARQTGLELAIRSGGHSAAGHGVCDGRHVLEPSPIRALPVDSEDRSAAARAGPTGGQESAAA